ncbi:MAG TPA: single-stranded DNA-binding protein [Acidimicrobiales bacterium]|nr:single-stranded DNA-binding protein [Acidimicrobiales bacterium]
MPTATNTKRTTTNAEADAKAHERPERQVEKKGEVYKIGNLTRDPELHFAATGATVARTGLAVERPKVPGDWAGERVTEFYELTIFRDLAENAAVSLAKGSRVVLVGNAELEHWTDDQDQERTTKRILVNAIGPDLRWATATVHRPERKTPRSTTEDLAVASDDEEPF